MKHLTSDCSTSGETPHIGCHISGEAPHIEYCQTPPNPSPSEGFQLQTFSGK